MLEELCLPCPFRSVGQGPKALHTRVWRPLAHKAHRPRHGLLSCQLAAEFFERCTTIAEKGTEVLPVYGHPFIIARPRTMRIEVLARPPPNKAPRRLAGLLREVDFDKLGSGRGNVSTTNIGSPRSTIVGACQSNNASTSRPIPWPLIDFGPLGRQRKGCDVWRLVNDIRQTRSCTARAADTDLGKSREGNRDYYTLSQMATGACATTSCSRLDVHAREDYRDDPCGGQGQSPL